MLQAPASSAKDAENDQAADASARQYQRCMAPDTFRAFVDAVAASLDAPARSDELAARLHLSRSQLDRVVTVADGEAPAAWRSRPGGVHLAAPNRVHFHPPGGLRLPAQEEVTSMDLIVTMTEQYIWHVGQLIQRATRLDDGQLDAPIELSVEGIDDDPTTRSVLSRLVDQMDIWNHAVANRPYDFSPKHSESIDSMRDRLADRKSTRL